MKYKDLLEILSGLNEKQLNQECVVDDNIASWQDDRGSYQATGTITGIHFEKNGRVVINYKAP